MEVLDKTLKSGFSMPAFGIGTWGMGGRHEQDPNNDDEKDVNAIKGALKFGIFHIDTAEAYSGGHSEELVGEAIKGFDRRKLFLTSKVSPKNFRYDDLIASCRASLERLEVDYLDLYLLHHPSEDVSMKETMKGMDELVGLGLVKHIGVSNFNVKRLMRAQDATKNKIVADQVHYNLKFREPEQDGLLSYCQENDVMLCAWRPVEKGFLAERGTDILDKMSKKYNRTPAQIAINWLITQDNVVTIAKSSEGMHLQENVGALGWVLESDDVEILRDKFPNQEIVSDAVPLG